MAIQILNIQQNSEEWFKAREGKASGSNGDILLTRGLEAALQENYNRFNGNYYTERGHILEAEAIEIYEAIHEVKVDRVGMVLNDKYPNASCSPDGIESVWLLEVKAFGKKHLEIVESGSIPFKIMAQLQFNMMITGKKKSRLILYNPDVEDPKKAYFEIEVKADKDIQANMARKLRGE